jgi:hypothetical protein
MPCWPGTVSVNVGRRSALGLWENFLYRFKAALRAARAADTGRLGRAPGRLARKAKAGPRKPGEVTEPQRT